MAALGNVSLVGLHQKGYGAFSRDLTIAVTGAQVATQSGLVVAGSVTGINDISCIGLAMPERTFNPKSLGDVNVSITGAAIESQAQQLLGSNPTIFLDDK